VEVPHHWPKSRNLAICTRLNYANIFNRPSTAMSVVVVILHMENMSLEEELKYEFI
jgi:hypothetical protein